MKMNITRENLPKILSTTLVGVIIIIGTILIVLYARGYRFNQNLGLVEKTGVLDIESDPSRNDIYIDGEGFGRTPKTISSLSEGRYKVEVARENYHTWESIVEIRSEKSTPIFPYLFMTEPEDEEIFTFEEEVVYQYNRPETNFIFIMTKAEILEGNQSDVEVPALFKYKIWRYNTDPSFWSATDNPLLLYETDGSNAKLVPSYSAEFAILEISDPDGENEHFLIDTSNPTSQPKALRINEVIENGSWSWAKDDNYLIIDKDRQIVSYNLSSDVVTLLRVKDEDVAWSTDEDGQFYYIQEAVAEESDIVYMQIWEMLLNGQANSIFIDKIYFSERDELLISEDELNDREELYQFTNSPNASQFSGKIERFHVENDIDSVIIETQYATYLYDLGSDKYTIVSTVPGRYVRLAPDDEKFLYIADEQLRIFTFDKEDADHITKLGNIVLTGFENGRKPEWLYNSRVITYLDGENLRTIDLHAENELTIHTAPDGFYAMDNGGENVFTLQKNDNVSTLFKAKVN